MYHPEFESDVISDGTQTNQRFGRLVAMFESDVISDGTQTLRARARRVC